MGWAQRSVGGWGFAALALGVHVPKWLSEAANLPLDKNGDLGHLPLTAGFPHPLRRASLATPSGGRDRSGVSESGLVQKPFRSMSRTLLTACGSEPVIPMAETSPAAVRPESISVPPKWDSTSQFFDPICIL